MLPVRTHGSQRGFSLIVIGFCFSVLLGMLGMTVDLGRMYIVKNELQAFADASALAGCRWLDGTASGVQAANSVALTGPPGSPPNGYDFGTSKVDSAAITTTYASAFAGPWVNLGAVPTAAPNTFRFLKVGVSVNLPMYFLAFVGAGSVQTVISTAVAAELPFSSPAGGLEPFVVDAPDPTQPSAFGFVSGQEYPLKGFVDLGQGAANSLRPAIVYTEFPSAPIVPGVSLAALAGNHALLSSTLAERSAQDTDQTSTTWQAYKQSFSGNTRRIVTLPVGSAAVIGFGNFLLGPAATINGGSEPMRVAYIGPASINGVAAPGGKLTQIHKVVLVQ
ncbi:MAG: Tad domain-containing protein [Acidobacteriota bacterium]|nr:Tad domain-containing protein [Acidobacteriota bacterium]